MRQDMGNSLPQGTVHDAVAELYWLRVAMTRFLGGFAVVVSGAILAAGALRLALFAYGEPSQSLPMILLHVWCDSYSLDRAGIRASVRRLAGAG
jgi:hypothetical protein